MAAAPWACLFFWSVSLLFVEDELFSALLDCLTSPLLDHGLSTVTGTLTFSCWLEASLSADCSVSFSLLPDWLWLTSWPPLPPPLGSPPLVTPTAAPPWACLFCWSVSLLLVENELFSA